MAEWNISVPSFDYNAPAGLFSMSNRRSRGGGMTYRRFATAAEAIRYSVEEVPPPNFPQISMEVDEDRFDHLAIAQLYESADYPLPRNKDGRAKSGGVL